MFKNMDGTLVTFGEGNDRTLEYNLAEGTIKLGKTDLSNASIIELKESLMALNFFGYRNQWKIDNVCKFFESADLLAEMDNFTNITSTEFENLFLTMIAVQEGVYVNKVNSAMHLNEMVLVSSATETVKLVKEFINYDASPILSEELIAENDEAAKIEKSRADISDKITFLEEKKSKVKDAISKLGETEELTEAMNLLEEEISKFEKSLQETYSKSITEKKSRKEYLDDGFVEAEVNKNGNGLKKGQEVMVSAEDYTSLGDNDSLECIDPKSGKTTICPKSQLSVKI